MYEERWKTGLFTYQTAHSCMFAIPQQMLPYNNIQFTPPFLSITNVLKNKKIHQSEINGPIPYSVIVLPQKIKYRNSKTAYNESLNLVSAIKEMNKNIGQAFDINLTCERFGIKRRMFFDFLSISSSFDIIQHRTNDIFIWNGSTLPPDVIKSFRAIMKDETTSIEELFSCFDNSSIRKVSSNLILLFSYLQTNILDLRDVGKLFTQGKNNYKTMLKKLYTIASALECLGILSKTGRTAEVKLNVLELIPNAQQNIADLNTLLNTKESAHQAIVIKNHQEQFQSFLKKTNSNTYL